MTMTVGELKEILKDLDSSMEVILCRDAEYYRANTGFGNESPLTKVDTTSYFLCDTNEGYGKRLYDRVYTAEEADQPEEDWAKMKENNEPVVVLVPSEDTSCG